jgi:ABC-type polysaccharide/polyol phosphate export permease
LGFAQQLWRLRGMIWAMARRELSARYVGAAGGMLWALLQPLTTVAVYWFVFSVGFKAQGPGGSPFILYFLCGYAPWLLFTETVQASAASVVGNVHLVKKTVFPTQILPLVHLTAATATHVVLLAVLLTATVLERGAPSPALFQLIYYFAGLCALALGLGWALAALQVFSRDVQQILSVMLNLWFWLTPVVWVEEMMPEELRWALRLNPMHYVVQGYRDALLGGPPFWSDLWAAAGFWAAAVVVLAAGAHVFRRLKPEFADVL